MPVMSPRTQQLQAGMNAGPDQEVMLFEQGFSEMAYNLLASRMPDVVNDVVTFKVLDADLDKGTGIGAFVVLRNGAPLYVPVVMVDNALKPLEVFYHKALNVFLPLTKGWLDEIDKNGISALGEGVKTPETLYTDVDIRNVVVPPITGRFSYAAWVPKALVDAARVCTTTHLEKVAQWAPGPMLPTLLAQAPNGIKRAFAKFLEKNPRTFKQAAQIYGLTVIERALEQHAEKTAAKQLTGGALWMADKDTAASEFRRVFGDKAGEAYAGVRLKGYAAKDTRDRKNVLVTEQPYATWAEPKQPGVYVLFDSAGKEHPAFVMPMPTRISKNDGYARRALTTAPSEHEDYRTSHNWTRQEYLAVFEDGSYLVTDKLVGQASVADEIAGALHKRMFVDVDGMPRAGRGCFVRQKGTTFQATEPLVIKSITTSDGTRRISAEVGYRDITISTDLNNALGSIVMPKNTDLVYVPADFLWVPLKEQRNGRSFHVSPHDVQAHVSRTLGSVGAKKVSVKDAGARQFSVNGSRALARIDALKKLAYEQRVSIEDAEALLEKAASDRNASAWVVSMTQLGHAQLKLAADDDSDKKSDKPKKKSPPPSDDAAAADPGMDPAMGADPMAAMAPPPAPPPPAPLDLAAMEMDQAIQQEMQKLVEKQQTIQMLLQRSSEIAGGAPPAPTVQTQAMGAPPSAMNLATGAPGPTPGPSMPGMSDPSMGMAPMPGQAVPQDPMNPMPAGDPSMMGQPGMGMDPSMMGGDPSMGMQGMSDPSMMGQQMPGAMMPPDGPNAMTLPQEVNPQFLDQAAQLHSADMFDAAAVATLSQSPALHGIVSQYLPNLEKAVDNLGRVLLTAWMQESDLKPQVGEMTFAGLEESLQSTFKGLGDLVLRLSRGVQAIKEPDDHAP